MSDQGRQNGARERVRLCVDSFHPIDPGNYAGPIHCTAHPEGHACVTALWERLPETTVTAAERQAANERGPYRRMSDEEFDARNCGMWRDA